MQVHLAEGALQSVHPGLHGPAQCASADAQPWGVCSATNNTAQPPKLHFFSHDEKPRAQGLLIVPGAQDSRTKGPLAPGPFPLGATMEVAAVTTTTPSRPEEKVMTKRAKAAL